MIYWMSCSVLSYRKVGKILSVTLKFIFIAGSLEKKIRTDTIFLISVRELAIDIKKEDYSVFPNNRNNFIF